MKKIFLASTCLLCGLIVGFVLNTILLFGGFRWPGMASQTSAMEVGTASIAIESTAGEPEIERSVLPSEPTPVIVDATVRPSLHEKPHHEALQYDKLQSISHESALSEQRWVLDLIVNAELDQILQLLAEIPNNNRRTHQQRWLIGLLTQRRIELDPDGALKEIEDSLLNISGFQSHNVTSRLLIEQYARLQPDTLMALLRRLPEGAVSPDNLYTLYSSLALSAPEAALEWVMQEGRSDSAGYDGKESILYAWSEKDPLAALRWLQLQGDSQFQNENASNIIARLAEYDIEAARAASVEFPGLVSGEIFLMNEVQTLAETDPIAAYAMAQSIDDRSSEFSAKQSVLYTWSTVDPIAAIEFVNALPDENERQMYAGMIVGSVGSFGSPTASKREELLAWAETLSPELKMSVHQQLILPWVEQEPQAALDWLNNQPESPEKSNLMQSMAFFIPAHDLQQAMALFPEADMGTRIGLASGILTQLYQTEPTSAWRWYEQMPDDEVKQSSLYTLVMITAADDPEQALALVGDALSYGTNTEMMPSLLQMLAFENPDIVENWLSTANMTAQQKDDIRAMIASNRGQFDNYPMPGMYDQYSPMMNSQTQYQIEY